MHRISPKVPLSTFFLLKQLQSMDLVASQQCIIFGCNAFVQVFHYFWAKIIFSGFGWFLAQNASKIGCFGLKSTRIQKGTYRYFLENPEHTYQNIPSNLYWAKLWSILLEEQSHCPLISFTSQTELKSKSPFNALIILLSTISVHHSQFRSPTAWTTHTSPHPHTLQLID